jgi:hypothetical protein
MALGKAAGRFLRRRTCRTSSIKSVKSTMPKALEQPSNRGAGGGSALCRLSNRGAGGGSAVCRPSNRGAGGKAALCCPRIVVQAGDLPYVGPRIAVQAGDLVNPWFGHRVLQAGGRDCPGRGLCRRAHLAGALMPARAGGVRRGGGWPPPRRSWKDIPFTGLSRRDLLGVNQHGLMPPGMGGGSRGGGWRRSRVGVRGRAGLRDARFWGRGSAAGGGGEVSLKDGR